MAKFDERLNQLFKMEKLSTVTAKTKIGISKTQLGRYLSGHYEPSLKNILILSKYFNCSIDYLIGLSDNKNFYYDNLPDFNLFLKRYQELLESNNTTHYQISKELKINRNCLTYWKKHKTFPSLYLLYKLAKRLNVTVDFLIGRTDYKEI